MMLLAFQKNSEHLLKQFLGLGEGMSSIIKVNISAGIVLIGLFTFEGTVQAEPLQAGQIKSGISVKNLYEVSFQAKTGNKSNLVSPLLEEDLSDVQRRLEENLVDGPVPYKHSGLPEIYDIFSDSGIIHTPYTEMEGLIRAMGRDYSNLVTVVSYGRTVQDRNLLMVRIEDRSVARDPNKVRPAIEISGAIHGNEYLGIEEKLAEYFLKNKVQLPGFSKFLAAGGVLYFIPVINPDGYEMRQRANSNGQDLNRDFDLIPKKDFRFTQPETKSLAQYLDTDLIQNKLKLRFALDYHCCAPALISPWSYVNKLPEPGDRKVFDAINALETSILGYPTGNSAETIGYLSSGTSKDYYYAKYGTISFTLEGQYGGESDHFLKHVQFLDRVFLEVGQAL